MGVLYAILVGTGKIQIFQAVGNAVPFLHEDVTGLIAGALLFLALAIILARYAQRKL